jgi:hypothetical protein
MHDQHVTHACAAALAVAIYHRPQHNQAKAHAICTSGCTLMAACIIWAILTCRRRDSMLSYVPSRKADAKPSSWLIVGPWEYIQGVRQVHLQLACDQVVPCTRTGLARLRVMGLTKEAPLVLSFRCSRAMPSRMLAIVFLRWMLQSHSCSRTALGQEQGGYQASFYFCLCKHLCEEKLTGRHTSAKVVCSSMPGLFCKHTSC